MKLISFGLYLVDIGFLPFSESLLDLVIEFHNWSKILNGIKRFLPCGIQSRFHEGGTHDCSTSPLAVGTIN